MANELGGLVGGGDALRAALDRVVAEAQVNNEFRAQLLSEPERTLEQFGLDQRLARGVAAEIGLFGGKCDDTCINNTGADCKSATCRLTDACGWTVCDTTNKATFLPDDPWNGLRRKVDDVLEAVGRDDNLKSELIRSPQATLEGLGVPGYAVGDVLHELGLGVGKCDDSCINNTGADCKDSTCRLTDACGWTVCNTTNKSLGGINEGGFAGLTNRNLGSISAADFLQALGTAGGIGQIAVWPEKKKRELWAEPEGLSELKAVDVLNVVRGEKKKLELETHPQASSLGSAREELLDQLANEVAGRLGKRGA
jgi:hypothetical protein